MNLKLIKKLCNLSKEDLERLLYKYLWELKRYKKIVRKQYYMFAEGNLPICLIAHMDTVFPSSPREKDFLFDPKKKVLWSPHGSGFDDRAGIYIILQLLQKGFTPSIIFTDLEEYGGGGSYELISDYPKCPFKKCNCLIQLDRANKNDSVYYNCNNAAFIKYINKYGFHTEIGSFSDISIIAPDWGIAAVNLSVGYEDEHTTSERLHINWCNETLNKVENILFNSSKMNFYEYIPNIFTEYRQSYYKQQEQREINKIIDEEDNRCLLCGDYLQEGKYVLVDDDKYPYCICNNCYKNYYDDKGDFLYIR